MKHKEKKVKFLVKIEDAINKIIIQILKKIIGLIPHLFFDWINSLVHIPNHLKNKIHSWSPIVKITLHHVLDYLKKYLTLFQGTITSVIIYLRSDKLKKMNKKDLILIPFEYIKLNPLNVLSIVFTIALTSYASSVILKNTIKIIEGTRSLRRPASVENSLEDLSIIFKNHKSEIKLPSIGGGHGAAEKKEKVIYLDITFEAQNTTEKKFLKTMEEMLEDNIEALDLKVTELPITLENKINIENEMVLSLNKDFELIGHPAPIKNIIIKQVFNGRRSYFQQLERTLEISDINLQIFFENIHRNRQISIDFSVLTSNINTKKFLERNIVRIRDHFNTNIEPVTPRFSMEEKITPKQQDENKPSIESEGRRIIKDKIKMELNIFIEKNKIEGKILEVYITDLIVS